jgi:hypothetical protein
LIVSRCGQPPKSEDLVREGEIDNREPALQHAQTFISAAAVSRMKRLSNEIVGSQHHKSVGLGLLFEKLTRCPLLNYFTQPHKLIYALSLSIHARDIVYLAYLTSLALGGFVEVERRLIRKKTGEGRAPL